MSTCKILQKDVIVRQKWRNFARALASSCSAPNYSVYWKFKEWKINIMILLSFAEHEPFLAILLQAELKRGAGDNLGNLLAEPFR